MGFRLLGYSTVALFLLAACGSDASNPGSGGAGPGGGDPGGAGPGGQGGSGGDLAGELTDTFCNHAAKCGEVMVVCSDDGGTGISCSAFTEPVMYDACAAEQGPYFNELFECVAPTSADVAMINTCIGGVAASECPTQEELDVYANAIEAGQVPAEPWGPPAECLTLLQLAHECDAKQGCRVSGSGTGSAGGSFCSTEWSCFSGTYTIDCQSDAVGYSCSCSGGESTASFTTDTCGPPVDVVNQACGWALPPE